MSVTQIPVATRATDQASNKLGLLPLTALVVGSMIGGGVFSLPQNMAKGASLGAMAIGWLISGIGILALALVYRFSPVVRASRINDLYQQPDEMTLCI